MEFASTGNDTPHEATGEARELGGRSAHTGSDFGSAATASETGLSVSGRSALDHVPQVADVSAETGSIETAAAEEGSVDAMVDGALHQVDAVVASRVEDVQLSNKLTKKIEALEGPRDAADQRVETADAVVASIYRTVRERTWAGMPKAEDGHAYGIDNVRRAVELSPDTEIENPATRAERLAVALAADGSIKQGVQTVISYYADGRPGFQVAVPTHDGFVVGQQQGEDHRFTVGINEPAIPIDEAWTTTLPPLDAKKTGAPTTPGAIESHIVIEVGDRVQPYLREISAWGTKTYAVNRRLYEKGLRSPEGIPGAEASILEDRQKHAAATLVGSINAARTADIPLFDETTPPTERQATVEALTNHLLDVTSLHSMDRDPEAAIATGQALGHVYSPAERRTLADHLVSRLNGRVKATQGSFDRSAFVEILVDVCGVDGDEAARRIYPRIHGEL